MFCDQAKQLDVVFRKVIHQSSDLKKFKIDIPESLLVSDYVYIVKDPANLKAEWVLENEFC